MKIVIYNETIISGGIEKCLELLSDYLNADYDLEIVYIDDSKLDKNIVNILSKNAYVHKLSDNEIVKADICIWCRLYFDFESLSKQIIANKHILWVHSKPRALPNCILDNTKFMSTVEKIICISETVKKEVNFPDKSIVIHNFVNNHIKKLASEITDPFYDIPADYLKLLIVSRLSAGKGFERVEKVIQDLQKNGTNFTLKIIGKGRKLEPIIRSSLEKNSQVEFLGYKNNPYPYIKNCDYLLVLSDYETWGNVISEAKVLGTPCIVSNFSSASEQIEDNKNGIIIPLESDNYLPYLNDLKSKNNILKQNLINFVYINEINIWKKILES